MMNRLITLLLVISLVACKQQESSIRTYGLQADSAIVVSAHPLASQIGVDIMRSGGNAVDASIAVQFALAVVHPSAGNLGGGGLMVIRLNDGSTSTLDFRETAPASATDTMYLDDAGNVKKGLSESGHLSCGVPGTVAGIAEAYKKYGKTKWKDLVQPAIDLAFHGVALTDQEAQGLNSIQDTLKKYNSVLPQQFIKAKWVAGDTLKQIELGHTLERIRDQGQAGFYEGKTADDLIAEIKRGGGIMTAHDLLNYKAKWRDALISNYKEFKIITMPPPSSGGIALIQLLKSTEPYEIGEMGVNTVPTIHLMTEAERRVYADRAVYLGDPDFYSVPTNALLNDLYITERMSTFNPDKATPSSEIKEGKIQPKESNHTTHISIVDSHGNAVSLTTTLNDDYGSKVVVSGAGFLLNDEMDDFSIKPGVANMYGAVGGTANKIEPGKRMLSSMTPTILERDGKIFMVIGSRGGTSIITSVFQTILNVVEHKMTMQEAVNTRRVHSQWLPDLIDAEPESMDSLTTQTLREMGHHVIFREGIGRVNAILSVNGKLEGGADPRGDNTAKGY
ncbi:MAG TPA: gamma-glutamyltransferase [Cyclobacteriaceae bacterium]|nr:gamma-glutamyltransferase [Cyclobacteriaceae bacterium]